jgi:lipoprotein-anchoring transpeptidase ErfK/SrfK
VRGTHPLDLNERRATPCPAGPGAAPVGPDRAKRVPEIVLTPLWRGRLTVPLAATLPALWLSAPTFAVESPAGAARPAARRSAARSLGRETLTATVTQRTELRDAPDGRIVATVGRSTEYGGRSVYRVVDQRPGWLGVLAPERPNGRVGWIPAAHTVLGSVSWAIEVDRSARRMTLSRAGGIVRRLRVTVGAPSSPTPRGRFAVTDKLRMAPRSVYGCCVLALTGYQTRGSMAGIRLAIHGTPSPQPLGRATSNGCVHVAADPLWRLMHTVPLGTPVTVVR